MKNIFYFLLLIACFGIISCQNDTPAEDTETQEQSDTSPTPPAANQLTEEEKAAGWELLFDGQSPDKWRGYNRETFPTKGWKIMDGNLAVEKSGTEEEGFGGDIITKDTYEKFELTLEFLCSDTANSGIFYRVNEVEDTPIWHNAPEYQILDNERYAEMGSTDIHFTAANYDLHPPKADYTKPIGQWNTAKIIVNNNQVEHWLNGNLAVSYELESPAWEALVVKSKFAEYPGYGKTRNGHIGLQDHGHLVMFRNMKVRRL